MIIMRVRVPAAFIKLHIFVFICCIFKIESICKFRVRDIMIMPFPQILLLHGLSIHLLAARAVVHGHIYLLLLAFTLTFMVVAAAAASTVLLPLVRQRFLSLDELVLELGEVEVERLMISGLWVNVLCFYLQSILERQQFFLVFFVFLTQLYNFGHQITHRALIIVGSFLLVLHPVQHLFLEIIVIGLQEKQVFFGPCQLLFALSEFFLYRQQLSAELLIVRIQLFVLFLQKLYLACQLGLFLLMLGRGEGEDVAVKGLLLSQQFAQTMFQLRSEVDGVEDLLVFPLQICLHSILIIKFTSNKLSSTNMTISKLSHSKQINALTQMTTAMLICLCPFLFYIFHHPKSLRCFQQTVLFCIELDGRWLDLKLRFIIYRSQMDQPQPCTKCKKLPEDILMLACGHDLCLDCASERLAFEMKKKKTANSIVCEICYQRTALDGESVAQLERLIPANKTPVTRSYAEPRAPFDRSERVVQKSQMPAAEERPKDRTYERQPVREYSYANNSNSALMTGISNSKICGEHHDEEILYFCFDCKCECICPECIIHGKHKDHDVKTIKKSAPAVKGQLEKSVDRIESSIENLLIKKSEVEKSIRTFNEQNAQQKRQIQSAFEEVKLKLAQKEKEILAKFDSDLNDSVEELEKSIKAIIKRIEDLRGYSSATTDFLKREDMLMINFYAKRHKEINEQCKEVSVTLPNLSPVSNDKILTSILELTDHTDRIAYQSAQPDRRR